MSRPSLPSPLEGILVVDLTRAVAGPFCTMMLGDLGARVIKVEEPAGDETRRWGPPFAAGESTYFLSMNRNKESLALNLKEGRGRDLFRRLAARADVVIENFRPGVVDRLGAGYRDLAPANPRLIYVSISGFGQTGPERHRPGYDLILQAMSGLMYASGNPGQRPAKTAFPVADIIAALFAGQAILAALFQREKTGQGRYIEISLLEGMLAAMCSLSSGYLLFGEDPAPIGTAQANIVPYQMFPCQDAHIVIGVTNERIWPRFCEALERPEWLAEPRYQGNESRNRHREELVAAVEQTLRTRPAAYWLARLEEHEVPCGPVCTVGQALSLPQVAERGAVVEIEHARLGKMKAVANPMRMDGFQPCYTPPPALGEQTETILGELTD